MVAYTWGRQNVQRGDLVVLTDMEHHSNIVPWQLLCQDREAELAYVAVGDDGLLDLDSLDALLERGPRLVALVHVSNVLGTVNPVSEIARRAHSVGAVVVVDGTQAVPQMPVFLPDLDVDFYAWTGHKAYGPTGIGVLHGRRELLEEMPPFIGGGHMIRTVAANESTWTDLPHKFEAAPRRSPRRYHEHRRRPRMAAVDCSVGLGGRPTARLTHAHGRGAADERGRRLGRVGF